MAYIIQIHFQSRKKPNIGNWRVYGIYERLSKALRFFKQVKKEAEIYNRIKQDNEVTKIRIVQNGEVIAEE